MTWLGQNAAAFHGVTCWATLNDDKQSFRRYGGGPGTAVAISVARRVVSASRWPARTQPLTSTGFAGFPSV
jgi:hypothetical protein